MVLIFVGSGWVGRKVVVDFGQSPLRRRRSKRSRSDAEVKGHAESGLEGGARAHGDDEDRGGGVDEAGEQSAEVRRLAKSLSVTTEAKKEELFLSFLSLIKEGKKELLTQPASQIERASKGKDQLV